MIGCRWPFTLMAAMATAAKLTIAEVREFVPEPMAHTEVQLPGAYVDRVVVVGG